MTPTWYSVYLSVGIVGTSVEPIWYYPTWIRAVRILEPLTAGLTEPVAVRTIQDDGADGPKLGRIGWNEKGHRKWTHSSPDNAALSRGWRFLCGEVWSPSWSKCGSSDRAPDLFVGIESRYAADEPMPGSFNQLLNLALPLERAQQAREAVQTLVRELGRLVRAEQVLGRVVPWYQDSMTLQSEINNHLRYGGIHEDVRYRVDQTLVQWTLFEALSW